MIPHRLACAQDRRRAARHDPTLLRSSAVSVAADAPAIAVGRVGPQKEPRRSRRAPRITSSAARIGTIPLRFTMHRTDDTASQPLACT